jgi:hypothetical protein
MKNIPTFLILLSLVFSLNSCEKEDDENVNFYDTEYRSGLWINAVGPVKKDTLHFVDDLNLIRRGDFYVHEEYLYRVDGKNLFIRLPGTTSETQHPITVVDKKTVVLGNMYITIGFGDGSGTFLKEN